MTKEAQRAELHKTIWRIANDLRGSVDGWDFKTYVLGMLFYRFISENLTAYLNDHERKSGSPDFDYSTLADEAAEFGRRETVAEKGFYILPERAVRQRSASRQERREPQRDARTGVHEHRGLRGRQRQRVRPQGSLRRPRRQQFQARVDRREAQREPGEAARRDRRAGPRRLRRQHDRCVRRRLRVPDDDVRVERRQVRRRVLHPAGGVGAAGAHHRGRQDGGQPGVRPGVRLGFAAPAVREGARSRERPPGVLRSGDQPDHLQLVPDQHVPARHQLREVRHRSRRHADRSGALGRRAVRGDRVQSSVLDEVGRRRQRRCSSTTLATRPLACSPRRARPTSPSRCTS